jgi:hypothetical protein
MARRPKKPSAGGAQDKVQRQAWIARGGMRFAGRAKQRDRDQAMND